MEELKQVLKSKKSLASLIILAILILVIPAGIYLVKTQKILKSRATGNVYNSFEVTGVSGSPLPYTDQGNTRIYNTDDLEVSIKIKDLNELLGN